ncbi:nitrate/nitrite transporter [Sporosarcina sp. P21c]|uniref:MFS transporter n=1 Tax=unclassified Sporosarcina TaxID=2647733 RepID=UPI000C16EA2D|nr:MULTISPECIES: nitrate/nitrite transporter [unclassified Sporosarcina]PIC66863.1 nitrate/nitrite transporter [Sporosarcina sp. P16a]PIC89281.1 nitrate/nitrite transporter [Sporosarcina sp. P21c]PIC91549.1 nitrate/nitrite transporter [Sporosarcina sp. P25]
MIQKIQLPLQTANLVVGFMVWVLISSLLPFISEDISIPPERVAIITAIPVVLGSILRIPLGYYANVYGARMMFFISFIVLLFPVYYISETSTVTGLLIGGTLLGIGGAIFSVGVTSLPKYYPKEKHGLVNGIYGMGNIGTAITTFSAPVLAMKFGWSMTVKMYLILLLVFIAMNFFFGDRKEVKVKAPIVEQIKGVYKNEKLWFFSLFYFITFGSFVAFTVFLPSFLVNYFELDKVDAGLRTAGFIVVATLLRPVGGWLGDKFQPLFLLMGCFAGLTISSIVLAFSPDIGLYTVGSIMIAAAAGLGNGVIFKLVPMYFSKQAGTVNGIVSMMGGLGGFFPPLLLAMIFSMTGSYSIGFMAFSQVSLVSLVLAFWLYYMDRTNLSKEVFDSTGQGILVTNSKGAIVSVNPAFTKLTGYSEEEVLGKSPNILSSGRHDREYYHEMWRTIDEQGVWQGEIWNKKKSGEEYLEFLSISSVKDGTGDVVRYVGSFSDISPEIRAGNRS